MQTHSGYHSLEDEPPDPDSLHSSSPDSPQSLGSISPPSFLSSWMPLRLDPLSSVSIDSLSYIFAFLTPAELFAMGHVSRHFRLISCSQHLWPSTPPSEAPRSRYFSPGSRPSPDVALRPEDSQLLPSPRDRIYGVFVSPSDETRIVEESTQLIPQSFLSSSAYSDLLPSESLRSSWARFYFGGAQRLLRDKGWLLCSDLVASTEREERNLRLMGCVRGLVYCALPSFGILCIFLGMCLIASLSSPLTLERHLHALIVVLVCESLGYVSLILALFSLGCEEFLCCDVYDWDRSGEKFKDKVNEAVENLPESVSRYVIERYDWMSSTRERALWNRTFVAQLTLCSPLVLLAIVSSLMVICFTLLEGFETRYEMVVSVVSGLLVFAVVTLSGIVGCCRIISPLICQCFPFRRKPELFEMSLTQRTLLIALLILPLSILSLSEFFLLSVSNSVGPVAVVPIVLGCVSFLLSVSVMICLVRSKRLNACKMVLLACLSPTAVCCLLLLVWVPIIVIHSSTGPFSSALFIGAAPILCVFWFGFVGTLICVLLHICQSTQLQLKNEEEDSEGY